MTPAPRRIAVLISGEGTNLQALIDAARDGTLGTQIAVVISNRAEARGLERARGAGIPARCLAPTRGQDRAAYDSLLGAEIAAHGAELVVLAGFMRILSARFVDAFAGRILNVHPSLLPAYPGLETHRRVLDAGERWHGATVHFVTAELDAGPAVIQYRLAIRRGDTTESLAERVHVGEHIILPRAAAWLAAARLSLQEGCVMLDGWALSQPVVIDEEAEPR
jgi:phosphoribosylglycinamide formyltransferase-1